MKHLESTHFGDFVALYEDDVEMVTVARRFTSAIQAHAVSLLEENVDLQCRWIQAPGDEAAANDALATSIQEESRRLFADEIAAASDMLGELLGCDEMGVRLMTLRRPMCPRFHVDAVSCRLLMTVDGPGTQWIARDDVDSRLFEDDRSRDVLPLRSGAEIQQLGNGSWTLMKGGAWQEGFDGVVHRSPREGPARLLISMDPLFSDGAA